MTVQAGSILTGPQWPEPVEVNYSEDLNEYVHIVEVAINSRVHIDRLIKKSDLPASVAEKMTLIEAEIPALMTIA